MNMSAKEAVKILIHEARAQRDSVSWAAAILRESGASPEDVVFFVESFNAAAARNGAALLAEGNLPRCSFCLKTSAQVRWMVTAPNANICDECSNIVQNIFAEKHAKRSFLSLFAGK